MKRLFITAIMMAQCVLLVAQKSVIYETYIYTNENLKKEIAKEAQIQKEENTRGLAAAFSAAALGAMKTATSGTISTFVDLGITMIGQAINKKDEMKKSWEQQVKKENTFVLPINSVAELNDFYAAPSYDNALDPQDMRFDGIGCLRKDGDDTVLFISCHIDHDKIDRIVRHSKFEMVLDTLIIMPKKSNLPNTTLDIPFYFSDRGSFNFNLSMTLTSSWINEATMVFRDEELGNFNIGVCIDSTMLDSKGVFRFVRQKGVDPQYKVVGESFIVPRSYAPVRENGVLKDNFGTGQYKLQVELTESCGITKAYRDRWEQDMNKRNEKIKKGKHDEGVTFISKMKFDQISKQWVITTVKSTSSTMTNQMLGISGGAAGNKGGGAGGNGGGKGGK